MKMEFQRFGISLNTKLSSLDQLANKTVDLVAALLLMMIQSLLDGEMVSLDASINKDKLSGMLLMHIEAL